MLSDSCRPGTKPKMTMADRAIQRLFIVVLSFLAIPVTQAQFDDVYYDPDNYSYGYDDGYYDSGSDYDYSDDVTYYDDDSYEYYDDYDYYYTSRIRRFYRPVYSAGFYDPFYTSFHFYDPFYYDAYYYPGASIYISFGNNCYRDYHRWRRWNRWNRWNNWGWGNYWGSPASYYYSYNSWCGPGFNYWGGGYHGYYSYSNYYNNYYNSCPFPVSNWNGITHTTVHHVNDGNTRGSYYGPRVTGNTGSSPRGPVTNPGVVAQPVLKNRNDNMTDSNDKPIGVDNPGRTGGLTSGPGEKPSTPAERPVKTDPAADRSGDVRQVPIDREVSKDKVNEPKRPVFRPDPDRYQPYPSNRPDVNDKPADKPTYRPYTPQERPSTDRGSYSPPRGDDRPAYQPPPRQDDAKPSYTPPQRDDKPSYNPPRRSDDMPSYKPPARNEDSRPSYNPPPRQNDNRPSYNPPPRNNDRPSYSPPARSNDNSRSSGGGSSYSPSRSSGSSSGSSSRSSGGSSSSPRSSPRGGGE